MQKTNSFFKRLPRPCVPTLILQPTDFYRDGSASLQPCSALKTALATAGISQHLSHALQYEERGRTQVSLLTFTRVIRLLNQISGECSCSHRSILLLCFSDQSVSDSTTRRTHPNGRVTSCSVVTSSQPVSKTELILSALYFLHLK